MTTWDNDSFVALDFAACIQGFLIFLLWKRFSFSLIITSRCTPWWMSMHASQQLIYPLLFFWIVQICKSVGYCKIQGPLIVFQERLLFPCLILFGSSLCVRLWYICVGLHRSFFCPSNAIEVPWWPGWVLLDVLRISNSVGIGHRFNLAGKYT